MVIFIRDFKLLSIGHHKWVWDCAFSCDSQLLVTCSTDCVAKIWNIESGEVIRNFAGHTRGKEFTYII